jgi:hypothetical protein
MNAALSQVFAGRFYSERDGGLGACGVRNALGEFACEFGVPMIRECLIRYPALIEFSFLPED